MIKKAYNCIFLLILIACGWWSIFFFLHLPPNKKIWTSWHTLFLSVACDMAFATGPVTSQCRSADECVLPVFGPAAAVSVDRLCLSNLPHSHLLHHPLHPPDNLRRYVWVECWRTSNMYFTSYIECMKLKVLFWVCISCSHSWSRWSTSEAWEKDACWPRLWREPGGFGKRQWVLHTLTHACTRLLRHMPTELALGMGPSTYKWIIIT